MHHATTWATALLITLAVGSAYVLDGPSEPELAAATASSLADAIDAARATQQRIAMRSDAP